jgi:hypothetical protein
MFVALANGGADRARKWRGEASGVAISVAKIRRNENRK